MVLVALTGGIAAGKSTIATRLEEHGAARVDADAVVRSLQEPGMPVLAELAAHFGADVIRTDGTLDRPLLGQRALSDESGRDLLGRIMNPPARQAIDEALAAAVSLGRRVVVYEAPLLGAGTADRAYDLIVVASAPVEARITRLMTYRGMSAAEARSRVAAQGDEKSRLAVADVVIRTDGPREQTVAAADALWRRLTA